MLRLAVGILQGIDHLGSLFEVARELRDIQDNNIRSSYLLAESLWLLLRINDFNSGF